MLTLSHVCDQQHLTISEVAVDWYKLVASSSACWACGWSLHLQRETPEPHQRISSVDIRWQYATLSACCHRHRVGRLVCPMHARKQHRYRDQYNIGWISTSLVGKRLRSVHDNTVCDYALHTAAQLAETTSLLFVCKCFTCPGMWSSLFAPLRVSTRLIYKAAMMTTTIFLKFPGGNLFETFSKFPENFRNFPSVHFIDVNTKTNSHSCTKYQFYMLKKGSKWLLSSLLLQWLLVLCDCIVPTCGLA